MSIIEGLQENEKPVLNAWLTDDELFFKKLKSHDLHAFKSLYKFYASPLLGSIRRAVNDEKKSELILEKTFIEVWNTISVFDESKYKLFTWMNQIARKLISQNTIHVTS
ncbi:hypothetical protein EZJ43_05190 [Pedobacter changchengzhani]|uniref:RNA polymerase sigma-70 region 2 domain-containing protein n=1 Tax=Pedobacter changchengzhani TaxID=2529274 RepID=A0A4R5MLV5_9SPHI|nr:hypothetical protein [Pedobacter changchengzhani]TDG36681.1 hypothetical protein EZJ43_05190 [Pedobacter changchengzhani]